MKCRYFLIFLLVLPFVVASGAQGFTAVISDPPSEAAVNLRQQQQYWHIAMVCLAIAALVGTVAAIWFYVKKRRKSSVVRQEGINSP